jgi:hypothetical protein
MSKIFVGLFFSSAGAQTQDFMFSSQVLYTELWWVMFIDHLNVIFWNPFEMCWYFFCWTIFYWFFWVEIF